MHLYIAGGCGEHGRNSFLLDLGGSAILVDCGVSDDSKNPEPPKLSRAQIDKISHVFLTHSHSDHTEALPWLFENGYDGPVIATRETLAQLPFEVKNGVVLQDMPEDALAGIGARLNWGRTGHCIGCVWYCFRIDGKTVLFTGDYTETTAVYATDRIRGVQADIAVIDCAYGRETVDYEARCSTIISVVSDYARQEKQCILPVPKYGRSVELLALLKKACPGLRIAADAGTYKAICEIAVQTEWLQEGVSLSGMAHPYCDDVGFDVLFIGDAQLKRRETRELADRVIASGGTGIITGTPDRGSYSEKLLAEGKITRVRYPVHQNYDQYVRLVSLNSFKEAIPYHSPEFSASPVHEI